MTAHASRAAHARAAKSSAPARHVRNSHNRARSPRETVPAPPERKYLTLIETVAEYGGSTSTWRHRVNDGLVASVKLAGDNSRVLIERASVEAFFQAGYRKAVTPAS